MADEWARDEAPTLQEETRAARGRALELVVSVVGLSTLFGLALNLASGLLQQLLTTEQDVILVAACAGLGIFALAVFIPRISTTVKEFHEELEIALPLLVSSDDVEVVRIEYYDEITEVAHAALARRPAMERRALADALRAVSRHNTPDQRRAVAPMLAEMLQFLLFVQIARSSRRLLGSGAAYQKYRGVAHLQERIVSQDVKTILAASVHKAAKDRGDKDKPLNRYLLQTTSGVPEKLVLPGGIHLHLLDTGRQLQTREKGDKADTSGEIALLRAEGGRDATLTISAFADFTHYGLPSIHQPRRGLTVRCLLRNARDQQLRALARDEEAAADAVAAGGDMPDPQAVAQFAEVHNRLFNGSRQLMMVRAFVRLDGAVRIRLLSGERRQMGIYAWGAALARQMERVDSDTFIATLKDLGQPTPIRLR